MHKKLLRQAAVHVSKTNSDCLSPIVNVPASVTKPIAACATHVFAFTTAHVPCEITEREALTMITVVRGCERSDLVRMPVCVPCGTSLRMVLHMSARL